MPKYVDIEPIVKRLTSVCVTDDSIGLGVQMGLNKAIEIIAKARIVEAEPVVHAHWEDVYGGKYANPRYRCSACKAKAQYKLEQNLLLSWKEVQALTPRCSNCGAHMDEDLELRTCYCPMCDKHFKVRSNDSMGDCPDCGHHVVLRIVEVSNE